MKNPINIFLKSLFLFLVIGVFATTQNSSFRYVGPPDDSTNQEAFDTNLTIKSNIGHDRFGDPISNPTSKSPWEYKTPNNVKLEVEPTRDLKSYTIRETVGDSM